MVIEIREPDRQDKAQWLSLWQGYTRFYGSPQPTEVTEYTWQRMLDAASPMLGRFAVVDGNVVGFAICILHEGTWVKTPICYLEDLFVAPQMRGQGIARTLIQALQTEGKEKGGRACTGTLAPTIRPGVCMMNSRQPMTMFVTA